MDFVDQVKALAVKIPGQLSYIKTETATRNALVEPFIRALGYDTSDLTEVVPEFGADLDVPGVPKNKKIDYGILKDGKPLILIECKCYNDKLNDGYKQLFHYAVATDCRIGVLTNGLIYRFYADLDKPSKLDESPFLELDMLNLKEPLLEELKSLTKTALNIPEMLTAANELKYVGGMLQILSSQLNEPSDEFVKFFFQQLCSGRVFAGSVKPQFAGFTKRAMKQFIREQINSILDASGIGSTPTITSKPLSEATEITSKEVNASNDSPGKPITSIVTTEEELEAFYIVKAILRDVAEPKRIFSRDVATYFGVLLDNNNRKPICRFYFNSPQNKRLALFDKTGDDKQEEKVVIEQLDDIYKYADRLKSTVARYS